MLIGGKALVESATADSYGHGGDGGKRARSASGALRSTFSFSAGKKYFGRKKSVDSLATANPSSPNNEQIVVTTTTTATRKKNGSGKPPLPVSGNRPPSRSSPQESHQGLVASRTYESGSTLPPLDIHTRQASAPVENSNKNGSLSFFDVGFFKII